MINNEKYSIALPGRVVAYYPEDQTADVIVSVERITHSSEDTYNSTDRTSIKKMPVHIPSGGGWSLTFPIKPGDTCLLLFSQIGYDHWLYSDKDKAGTLAGLPKPHLSRQFNEDDGFCLVGFNTIPRKITDHHETGAELRGPVAADQHILLAEDNSITITSSVSLTINAPAVTVNCETAEVNASTGVDLNTPITAISDDVTIGGTLEVTGIVTNLATVITSGITTTGGLAVAGGAAADMGSGACTSTGSMTVNGVDVETHTHPYTWTDGGGSGNTSAPN